MKPVHQMTPPTASARRSSEAGGSRSTGVSCSSGCEGRCLQAAPADALVHHRPCPGRERVPGGDVGGQAVVEGDPFAVHRHRAPGQGGAGPGQGGQAEAAAGGEDRHGRVHDRRVGQVARALVHEAGLGQPLDGLAAPVPEGHAADGAGRQDHPATAGQEVLGDLAARLGAADHQHRPAGELAGTAVVRGVELGDPPGQPAGQRRDPGPVLVAGGHHHRPGQELAVVGGHRPARRRPGPAGRPGRRRGPGGRRRAARGAGRPPGRRRRRRGPARPASGSSSRRC